MSRGSRTDWPKVDLSRPANLCAEIDGLIAEKETLITNLEAYKKPLIFECVTGKRRVMEDSMPPSLQELVEIAMENQPYILEQDLKDGGPLCYYDKEGRFVIRYPDGTIEYHDRLCSPDPAHCIPVRNRCHA